MITSRFTSEAPAVNPSQDVQWTRGDSALHVCVADLSPLQLQTWSEPAAHRLCDAA